MGHGSSTDRTTIGSDTPAVSSVTVALNLSEMTWTACSLSDICLLSCSIHDMSTVSSKLYWQNLEWQTIMDLNLHHTHDFLALWRASFKQSEVGPSESNGRENYWNIQLFISCFRRVRCRCYENLTTKFLKGHTNYSWSKQSWVFFHTENILFHPLKVQDRMLLPALFISQAVRKETLGIPLRNQLHYMSWEPISLPS